MSLPLIALDACLQRSSQIKRILMLDATLRGLLMYTFWLAIGTKQFVLGFDRFI